MFVVGIGGTLRRNSTSAWAVKHALSVLKSSGSETQFFDGHEINLEMYDPGQRVRSRKAMTLIDALRRCDGLVVASPGYHGSISGLVKNALDYAEDLRDDPLPYFDGRPVGCIACAAGWQAAHGTLVALRAVTHALRGWPTPIGVTINSSAPAFDANGNCLDPAVAAALSLMSHQILDFASRSGRSKAQNTLEIAG